MSTERRTYRQMDKMFPIYPKLHLRGGIKYKHAGVMSFNNFLVFLTYSTKQQIGKELSIASLFALPWCRTPTFTIVVSHKINTPILDIGRNCSSSILKVKKNVKMLKVNTRNQTRTDYIS